MPRLQIFFLFFLLFGLLTAGSSLADNVTFDLEPLDRFYGTPVGMSPGDNMFTEGGVHLWITDFFVNGTPYFNFAQIDSAFSGPSIFFGNNQILEINNVGVVFNFSSPGNVTFEYLDLGGSVNLRVNGLGAVLEATDLGSLAGGVSPGVTMTVVNTPVEGGHMAEVTLTGPVQMLRLGGQEFWVDNVVNDNGGGSDSECNSLVNHQSLTTGMAWGDGLGDVPGDFIFAEDGIPVRIGEIVWSNGDPGFNTCEVMVPGIVDFGFDQVMNLNNVSNIYDIGALGMVPTIVSFEFADFGGTENLMVNGHNLFVGDLDSFGTAVAPGVTLIVQSWPMPTGGMRGVASLFGNVSELLVAGQELFIDNLCIEEDGFDPGECGLVSMNESQDFDTVWSGSNHNPGDIIFTEDGIDVSLELLITGGNWGWGFARIAIPWSPSGSGNVLRLIDISAQYDLTPFSTIQSVSFEFCKSGWQDENLGINGDLFEGDLSEVPVNYFPGILVNIESQEFGYYTFGKITLVGDVQQLLVGGHNLYLDNLCVNQELSPVPDVVPEVLTLGANFPNPFNPQTTIRFSLQREQRAQIGVYDLTGRLINVLTDSTFSPGDHSIVWNGKDAAGRTMPSGNYIVRLKTGERVESRKVSLIK